MGFLTAASLLLIGTVGQGCTPPSSPISAMWMTAFRTLQGVSYGGKYCIGNVVLAESAPPPMLAMSRALLMVPLSLGYMTLSAVVIPMYTHLSPRDMQSWGWRLPMLLSGVLAFCPVVLFWWEIRETYEGTDSWYRQADHDDVSDHSSNASSELRVPDDPTPGIFGFLSTTYQSGLVCVAGLMLNATFDGLAANYMKAWLGKWCGYSDMQSGLLLVGSQLTYIPSCVFILWVADKIGLCANIPSAHPPTPLSPAYRTPRPVPSPKDRRRCGGRVGDDSRPRWVWVPSHLPPQSPPATRRSVTMQQDINVS